MCCFAAGIRIGRAARGPRNIPFNLPCVIRRLLGVPSAKTPSGRTAESGRESTTAPPREVLRQVHRDLHGFDPAVRRRAGPLVGGPVHVLVLGSSPRPRSWPPGTLTPRPPRAASALLVTHARSGGWAKSMGGGRSTAGASAPCTRRTSRPGGSASTKSARPPAAGSRRPAGADWGMAASAGAEGWTYPGPSPKVTPVSSSDTFHRRRAVSGSLALADRPTRVG